ncbi:ZinT/AdcA family metal-binding protein [Agrobacterium pusense]|nr:metal-binding protein ZinT [Agrobacterium pusense]
MNKVTSWPTYYRSSMKADEIVSEMKTHRSHH